VKTYKLALQATAGPGITCGIRFDATDDEAARRFARTYAQAHHSSLFGLHEALPGHDLAWDPIKKDFVNFRIRTVAY
jgi:hypothetical protein